MLKSLLTSCVALAASVAAWAAPTVTVTYPSPGGTLTDKQLLESFNLSASGSYTVAADAKATLECLDTGDIFDSTEFRDFMGMAIMVKFDVDDITDNGEYELVIPAGSIMVNGEPCEKITATYVLEDPNLGGQTEFPQITLISSDPADGAGVRAIGANALNRVSFVTSDDAAVNYIGWELWNVTNPNAPEWVYQSSENRIDPNRMDDGSTEDRWVNGLFITIGGPDQKLIKGQKYEMKLVFCGIGYNPETNQYPNKLTIEKSLELETSIFFEGLTPGTEYSPYFYESVSPDEATYVMETVEEARFFITYTGDVRPDSFTYHRGQADTPVAGTFSPIDDEDGDGYASVWEFEVDPYIAANMVGVAMFNIETKDKDGLTLKGNGGYETDDFNYTVTYETTIGLPDLISVAPEVNTEVEALSEIVVGNSENLAMAFSSNATEPARILDMQGAEIRVLGEPVNVSGNNRQMSWSFEPITKSGSYILMIPKWYFALGAETEGTTTKQTTFRYFVENGQVSTGVEYDLEPVSVTPSNYSAVSEISSVVLEFAEVTLCDMDPYPTATLEKLENGGRESIIVSEPAVENDWFSPTAYTFNFATPVTAPGTYLFKVEKGAFYDETYNMEMGEAGHANDELVYMFIIPEEVEPAAYDLVPHNVFPGDNSSVEEISTVVLEFEDVTYCSLEANPTASLFKVVGGEEYEVAVSEPAVDNDFFAPTVWTFNFRIPINAPGTYLFKVAKGSFFDALYDESMGETGHVCDELVYTFTIESGSGVDAIGEGAAAGNVYGIDGKVVLRNASDADVKALPAGLYIFNGKKLVVK